MNLMRNPITNFDFSTKPRLHRNNAVRDVNLVEKLSEKSPKKEELNLFKENIENFNEEKSLDYK